MQRTRTRSLLSLLLVLLLHQQVMPQHAGAPTTWGNFRFTGFTARNGLPSSEILSLHLDTRQLLWIGHTAGLSRFDGYTFTNYLFAHNKRIGRVFCFLEDTTRNILWIGAATGLFYQANNRIIPVHFSNGRLPVYSLLRDTNKGLWIGTGNGPAYLDSLTSQQVLQKGTIDISQRILPVWRNLNDDRRVKKMALQKDGQLLFGNFYNVYQWNQQSLQKIWGMNHNSDVLNGIVSTEQGETFICANFSGVSYKQGAQWKSLPIPVITGMDFHKEGNNWYYYNAEAIYEIDVLSKQYRSVLTIPYDYREWGSVFTRDKEGNFWIATHEGILYAKPEIFKSHLQETPAGFNELYSIRQLKDGSIITGGNRGRLFKKAGDQFQMAYPNNKTIFPHAELKSIWQSPDGDQWFGSGYEGLARKSNNQWQYFYNQGGGDKTFLHFHQDKKGDLWTAGDKNLTRIRKHNNDSLEFTQYTYRQEITDNPVIRGIIESPGGKIYAGSTWGLAVVQDKHLELIPLQQEQSFAITGMSTARDGKIWIATQGNGLLLCHFLHDSLVIEKQFTTSHGLSSDILLKTLVDNNNVLWAVAYNGVNRVEQTGNDYNIATREIDRELLKGDYQSVDIMQDDKGIIWMATSSGLLSFDPAVYAKAITVPSLHIENITMLQDEERTSLPNTNDHFTPVSLSHKQNSLEFLFTGINYSNPAAVQYEYRLLGQDSNWIRLRHTRQLTLRNIPPGDYTLQVRAAAGSNQWSNTVAWPFTVQTPFWQTIWFITLLIAAIAMAIYLLVRQRIAALRKKSATQRDFERQIARVKMNMLRAQMNPHFIFNSLNSINNFILKNDPRNASGYLTKFSRLMRMILDNSRTEWVTLENELNALDLYIQLESIRFDNRFQYRLHLDEEIDPARVIIPPLIIQPYVENAIWHGLLYREQPGGTLLLEIKRVKDQLRIKVADNGIGRAASAEMRSKSALKKKSHGMKITGERLEIVNMTYDANTSIEVEDLYDHHQHACGTSVLITLNYIQNKMV